MSGSLWRMRRAFWNGLAVLKFHGQKPAVIPSGTADPRPVRPRPVRHQVPRHPARRGRRGRPHPHRRGRHRRSGCSPGSSTSSCSGSRRCRRACPRCPPTRSVRWRRRTPRRTGAASRRPSARRQHDLGSMAVASPYASYLEATGDGAFRWDLTSLRGLRVPSRARGAGRDRRLPRSTPASGGLDPRAHRDRPRRREAGLGRMGRRRADGDVLDHVARVAGAALQLAPPHGRAGVRGRHPQPAAGRPSGAAAGVGARVRHPRRQRPGHRDPHVGGRRVRRHLQPHPPRQVRAVRGHHRATSTWPSINPRARRRPPRRGRRRPSTRPRTTAGRGCTTCSSATPSGTSGVYYASDDDLANDQALGALDRRPRRAAAARRAVGARDRARRWTGAASLLATIVYLATVEHEITGSGLWDYQLWSDTSPVRVYAGRPPVCRSTCTSGWSTPTST